MLPCTELTSQSQPLFQKTTHQIFLKDSRKMREIKNESVHLVVTSPPYWSIKDYGNSKQIGYNDSLPKYFRELGKVYGLPKEEIDRLVDYPDAGVNRDEITEKLFTMGNQLMDFPNIRSIHAGGVLISEEPITCYTALDMPPKGFHWPQALMSLNHLSFFWWPKKRHG